MPTKLRKLKITRVALCPQGANYDTDSGEGAHILLFKAAPPLEKQDVTTTDFAIPSEGTAGVASCHNPDCQDPDCPVHGPLVRLLGRHRPKKKRVAKGLMGLHAEPDGDETPPLDYATRGQQQELWSCLWDKWERFTGTFYDVVGDCDDDNVPHLPILVASIGQFQADIVQLLDELDLVEKTAEAFEVLADEAAAIAKAGAPMAAHRLARLKDAIVSLQQILDECTPATVEHPGISAAGALGIPYVMKGDDGMAVTKNAESDKEHCDKCDDKNCDNPAHDRMKKELQMAETVDGVTKRAEKAEAQVATLTARVAELEPQLTEVQSALAKTQQELKTLQDEAAIAKMSPEEQRETLLATMPELVRKSYLDQENRLALIEKANHDLQEKNERLDYIQKAVEFRPLGFNPDDHWEILKAIDAMPEAPRMELVRLLKAATEQSKTASLWSTAGSQGTSPTGRDGSAEAQILALAQAHQTDKGGTLGDAIGVIAKAHPDLWLRDQQEKRVRNRVETR
jgi:uncharacterized coiled-coil protein SlyX